MIHDEEEPPSTNNPVQNPGDFAWLKRRSVEVRARLTDRGRERVRKDEDSAVSREGSVKTLCGRKGTKPVFSDKFAEGRVTTFQSVEIIVTPVDAYDRSDRRSEYGVSVAGVKRTIRELLTLDTGSEGHGDKHEAREHAGRHDGQPVREMWQA